MVFVSGGAVLAVASALYQFRSAKAAKKKAKKEADKRKGFEIPVDGEIGNIPLQYGRGKFGGFRVFHSVKSSYVYSPSGDLEFTTSGDARSVNAIELSRSQPVSSITSTFYIKDGISAAKPPDGVPWEPETTSSVNITFPYMATLQSNNPHTFAVVTVTPGQSAALQPGFTVTVVMKPLIGLDGDGLIDFSGTLSEPEQRAFPFIVVSYNNDTGVLQLNQGEGGARSGRRSLAANQNGKKREFLFFDQALCITGINQVYACTIDDKDWRDDSFKESGRIHVYKNGGTADPMLVANNPERNTALFPETAHAAAVFKIDRENPQYGGVPEVAFFGEGMRVRYPITKVGNTYELSENRVYTNLSSYVLLDYLLDPFYGKGLTLDQIDLKSFYEAGRICERVMPVNGSTNLPIEGEFWKSKLAAEGGARQIHLYECNITIDTGRKVRDNISAIMDTMGHAFLIWSDGVYKLNLMYPVEYDSATTYEVGDVVQYPPGSSAAIDLYRCLSPTSLPPSPGNIGTLWEKGPSEGLTSAYITDDDIVLEDEVTQSWPALSDKLNFMTVRFKNEAKDFKDDSASWPAKFPANPAIDNVYSTYLAEDNGMLLESEVTVDGISDYYHAMAYAEEAVRSSRAVTNYKLTISGTYLPLEPGNVIQVDSQWLGINKELLQIISVKATEKRNLDIECIKFDARHYAWNAPDNEVVVSRNNFATDFLGQASNLVFIPLTPTDVTVLKSGTLMWDEAPGVISVYYDVKIRPGPPGAVALGSDWQTIGSTSDTFIDVPAVAPGLYTLTVVARGQGGYIAPELDMATGSRWPLLEVMIGATTLNEYRSELKIFKVSVADLNGVVPVGGTYDASTGGFTPPNGYASTQAEALAITPLGDIYYSTANIIASPLDPVVDDITWSPLALLNPAISSATVAVYYRQPVGGVIAETPTGGSWTFPEGPLVPPTGNVLWQVGIPAGEGTLYVTRATATRQGQYGVNTNNLTWSTPVIDGSDGAAGKDARVVTLIADRMAFVYTSAGTLDTSVATQAVLTAQTYGTDPSSSVTYSFYEDDVLVQGPSGANTYTYNAESDFWAMPDKVEVVVFEDSAEVARDQTTMFGLRSGSDSVSIILSNEAHSFPATASGAVTDYSGGVTDISVYMGDTKLQFDPSSPYSPGSFRVSVSGSGIASGGVSQADAFTCRTGVPSGFSSSTGYLLFYITVTSNSGIETIYQRRQSFTKSIAGKSALSMNIDNENHSFFVGPDGVFDYASYVGTVSVRDGNTQLSYGTGAGTFSLSFSSVGISVGSVYNSGGNARFTVYNWTSSSAYASVYVTATANSTGEALTKIVSFTKVSSGIRGYQEFLIAGSGSNLTSWASTAALPNNVAQYYANTVISSLAPDHTLRPLDRITVYNSSSGITGTRIYQASPTTSSSTVVGGSFSSLVREVIDGSLLVNGSVGADKVVSAGLITRTAQINNAMVNTLHLGGQAVSLPVYAGGGQVNPAPTGTKLCEIAGFGLGLSSEGDVPVLVHWCILGNAQNNGALARRIRVVRLYDGTPADIFDMQAYDKDEYSSFAFRTTLLGWPWTVFQLWVHAQGTIYRSSLTVTVLKR